METVTPVVAGVVAIVASIALAIGYVVATTQGLKEYFGERPHRPPMKAQKIIY